MPMEDTTLLTLTQSLAIIDYLDRTGPNDSCKLLPEDPIPRAHTLELVYTIACDTHPLQNLRIINMQPEEQRAEYARGIITTGLATFEALLNKQSGGRGYCVGDQVTLADVVLVPQVYNAKRWNVDMSQFPRINAICEHLEGLPAFILAHPDQQPDAPKQ